MGQSQCCCCNLPPFIPKGFHSAPVFVYPDISSHRIEFSMYDHNPHASSSYPLSLTSRTNNHLSPKKLRVSVPSCVLSPPFSQNRVLVFQLQWARCEGSHQNIKACNFSCFARIIQSFYRPCNFISHYRFEKKLLCRLHRGSRVEDETRYLVGLFAKGEVPSTANIYIYIFFWDRCLFGFGGRFLQAGNV